MKKFLENIKQQANLCNRGAMEAETIQKNAASPKSQMSRKNNINKL
jgi:hypothetical protein